MCQRKPKFIAQEVYIILEKLVQHFREAFIIPLCLVKVPGGRLQGQVRRSTKARRRGATGVKNASKRRRL